VNGVNHIFGKIRYPCCVTAEYEKFALNRALLTDNIVLKKLFIINIKFCVYKKIIQIKKSHEKLHAFEEREV
jgi:hypothetical protein